MYADWQNHQLRVSKAQEEAMVAGSMFGWDITATKSQTQEQLQKNWLEQERWAAASFAQRRENEDSNK